MYTMATFSEEDGKDIDDGLLVFASPELEVEGTGRVACCLRDIQPAQLTTAKLMIVT